MALSQKLIFFSVFCYFGRSVLGDECHASVENCLSTNGMLCNGKGNCICGKCLCHRNSYYMGSTCEDCPTCPGQCARLRNCVECMIWGSARYNAEDCRSNCRHLRMLPVDNLPENDRSHRLCQYRDDNNCVYRFAYTTRSVKDVLVERRLHCPRPSG
ncbi:integrin beta-PS-like isoform X2 [Tubulanus polymorphus]|uniref:integrin beta-PS-like isoform X2 n=1 Tax=Tubulanus polymorphus TaxID=672921 RepID=UPI003DA583C2